MNGSRGIVGPVDGGERVYFPMLPCGCGSERRSRLERFSFPAQDIRPASIDRVGTVMMIRSTPDGFWNG